MKKINLRELFEELYDQYGSQGWWPTTPAGKTHPEYHPGQILRELAENEQWEIIVGALLTQNTSWANAEKALSALQVEGLVSVASISSLPAHHLAALIRSSGYYNQKAKRLKYIARHILKHYGEVKRFLELPADPLREALLDLPGIGYETADSIILYAKPAPIFVVDRYTLRISTRVGLVEEEMKYLLFQEWIVGELPKDLILYNEFHALLVKHATSVCRSEPECSSCFLRSRCSFGG